MGQGRILIVEDSPVQALQLRRTLEQHGYEVTVARHGREGLERLQQDHPDAVKPDVIISDINMPEMDGYSMCAAIKQDPAAKQTPVILLTMLADPQYLVRGLEAQADYYLTKPYDEQILLARIEQVLRTARGEVPGAAAADADGLALMLEGQTHTVSSNPQQMMNLLLSTYENALQQNRELMRIQHQLEVANQQLRDQTLQLEHSQANYRALLENNADAMIVVDRAGNVRFLNPAARTLFGSEDQQFLSDLLKYSDAAGTTIELEFSRPGRGPVCVELRIVETQWEGEPASLATLRDVTARKRLESEVARLQKGLRDEG